MRFNPGKEKEEDYTLYNTRSIIMDTFHDLKEAMEEFTLDVEEQTAVSKVLKIITTDSNKVPVMKILVQYAPFSLSVLNLQPLNMLDLVNNIMQIQIVYGLLLNTIQ